MAVLILAVTVALWYFRRMQCGSYQRLHAEGVDLFAFGINAHWGSCQLSSGVCRITSNCHFLFLNRKGCARLFQIFTSLGQTTLQYLLLTSRPSTLPHVYHPRSSTAPPPTPPPSPTLPYASPTTPPRPASPPPPPSSPTTAAYPTPAGPY